MPRLNFNKQAVKVFLHDMANWIFIFNYRKFITDEEFETLRTIMENIREKVEEYYERNPNSDQNTSSTSNQ